VNKVKKKLKHLDKNIPGICFKVAIKYNNFLQKKDENSRD